MCVEGLFIQCFKRISLYKKKRERDLYVFDFFLLIITYYFVKFVLYLIKRIYIYIYYKCFSFVIIELFCILSIFV